MAIIREELISLPQYVAGIRLGSPIGIPDLKQVEPKSKKINSTSHYTHGHTHTHTQIFFVVAEQKVRTELSKIFV